jgi:RNA polymerase sigma factor (TIGR02999 family)
MKQGSANLSTLFARVRVGDSDALKEIVSVLHQELHRVAARQMRGEARHHTLQPTALVNEVYLRLMHGPDQIQDRKHFFALAAQAMRRALVDHARQKTARKRGQGLERVTLDDAVADRELKVVDVLAVDEALTALAKEHLRPSRMVELRFFGGHTDEEIADILGLSLPTVRRDWKVARAWLKVWLKSDP